MSFLSLSFVFVFLPIVLGIWILLTRKGMTNLALAFISVASAIFYAAGNPTDLILVISSALINYTLATIISGSKGARRALTLLIGICLNCAFLAYYKYTAFLAGLVLQVFDIAVPITQPDFPIGISFYTLQQIAYLVFVNRFGNERHGLLSYVSYVLFFPKILAGPIVYANEYFGQLGDKWSGNRDRLEDISVGLTLFCFGAFKKVVLSEPLAQTANAVFASSGESSFSAMGAWSGILAYTLQLYFDFSGYSDMAIGVSRMLGFKLPQNFNSPLRASSLLEFWQGWHMTMTRFFMEHIYNPIAIRLTRKELSRKSGRIRLFLVTVAVPTIIAFLVSGIWHGPGWNFVLFGLVHGVGLTINHAWRMAKYPKLPKALGWLLMLLTVMISLTFVRSPDLAASLSYLTVMFSGHWSWQEAYSLIGGFLPGGTVKIAGVSKVGVLFLAVGLGVVLLAPNTNWLLRDHCPALAFRPRAIAGGVVPKLAWRPSVFWAIAAVCALLAALLNLNNQSPFVYFSF